MLLDADSGTAARRRGTWRIALVGAPARRDRPSRAAAAVSANAEAPGLNAVIDRRAKITIARPGVAPIR